MFLTKVLFSFFYLREICFILGNICGIFWVNERKVKKWNFEILLFKRGKLSFYLSVFQEKNEKFFFGKKNRWKKRKEKSNFFWFLNPNLDLSSLLFYREE